MRTLLTDEQKKANRIIANKKWNQNNKDKRKKWNRKWYDNNRDKQNAHRESLKDDFYTLYFLPECNYVGMTQTPSARIYNHKSLGKDVSNYQIIATFTDKRDALDTERMLHDVYNFNGKNPHHQKK